ncbi:MAG: ergothioneine biosynthesis protein EgtB [Bacteroidetes bacterium]|nr:ergothioneine biosynthesis protein EgtB [Bacteroidota bacterium]
MDDISLLKEELSNKYLSVRSLTESLCEPLEIEDYVVQSMPDASPIRWHIAHTSWFFETFILKEVLPNYKPLNEIYPFLFNSYYVQAGERFARPDRGLLTRPTVKEVMEYRHYIDRHMLGLIEKTTEEQLEQLTVTFNIGLNHEQQHQELMLTDLKHMFSRNPLYPVYREQPLYTPIKPADIHWVEFEESTKEIGSNGSEFFYDNEIPRHKALTLPFAIADRLVTNGEFIEFMESGGYENQILWLSSGYTAVEENNWRSPLYWQKIENEWWNYTLNGFRKVHPDEPVTHISFYEAEAYAHWKGFRLPTEFEWERASEGVEIKGNFVDDSSFHPMGLTIDTIADPLKQFYGTVWEWTCSDYAPYPGYKVPPGAIGEYNGKFMSGQIVLRGGSCATSQNHIRKTYRNFFPHSARWQFMGIRLAKDLK